MGRYRRRRPQRKGIPLSDDAIAIDSAEFRKVLGHFPTGVTVVAAVADGKPAGLAVGAREAHVARAVLLAVARRAFDLEHGVDAGRRAGDGSSSSWALIRDAGHFVVNVLGDSQDALSGRFSSKVEDKFEGLDWSPAVATGGPRLAGCLAHIDCTLESIYDGGDHDIVVGRVQALGVDPSEDGPLLFFKGAYGKLAPLS